MSPPPSQWRTHTCVEKTPLVKLAEGTREHQRAITLGESSEQWCHLYCPKPSVLRRAAVTISGLLYNEPGPGHLTTEAQQMQEFTHGGPPSWHCVTHITLHDFTSSAWVWVQRAKPRWQTMTLQATHTVLVLRQILNYTLWLRGVLNHPLLHWILISDQIPATLKTFRTNYIVEVTEHCRKTINPLIHLANLHQTAFSSGLNISVDPITNQLPE